MIFNQLHFYILSNLALNVTIYIISKYIAGQLFYYVISFCDKR